MNTKLECHEINIYDGDHYKTGAIKVTYVLAKNGDDAREKIRKEVSPLGFIDKDLGKADRRTYHVYYRTSKIGAIKAANQIGDLLSHEYKLDLF